MVLAEEGLIVHRQNRGFGVPRLERADLVQIASVRLPLEVLALEESRRHATPIDLERLRHLKGELLEAFRNGGIRVCARPDSAFHKAVWAITGNPWLQAALSRVSMPYFAYVAAFNLGRSDHSLALMDEMHTRYIDFVAGQPGDTAAECAAFHLGLD